MLSETTTFPLQPDALGEAVRPVPMERVSKHRAGRHPKMRESDKRKRVRAQRQRISDTITLNIMNKVANAPLEDG